MTLQSEIDFELRQAARLQQIAADSSAIARLHMEIWFRHKDETQLIHAINWQNWAAMDYKDARQRHFEAMNIR